MLLPVLLHSEEATVDFGLDQIDIKKKLVKKYGKDLIIRVKFSTYIPPLVVDDTNTNTNTSPTQVDSVANSSSPVVSTDGVELSLVVGDDTTRI